jgi:hypothetical protein
MFECRNEGGKRAQQPKLPLFPRAPFLLLSPPGPSFPEAQLSPLFPFSPRGPRLAHFLPQPATPRAPLLSLSPRARVSAPLLSPARAALSSPPFSLCQPGPARQRLFSSLLLLLAPDPSSVSPSAGRPLGHWPWSRSAVPRAPFPAPARPHWPVPEPPLPSRSRPRLD